MNEQESSMNHGKPWASCDVEVNPEIIGCLPSDEPSTPPPGKPTLLETLDHPCRETCSGWQQGFERGWAECEKKLKQA